MLAGLALIIAFSEHSLLQDGEVVEPPELQKCSDFLDDLEIDQDSKAIGDFAPMPNLIPNAEKICQEQEGVFETKLVVRLPDHSLQSIPISVSESPNFSKTKANK